MRELSYVRHDVIGTSKNGSPIKKGIYLFECEYCHNTFERVRSKGKAARSCRECSLTKINPSSSHGMSKTRQYHVWRAMKQRCDNPKNEKYPRYGGRGITYDPKWKTFEGFWEDMAEGYNDILTIDRKDNDGNYTKDNCRWISGPDNSGRSKLKKVYKLKKVISYELIAEYGSGNEAERESGTKSSVISDVVSGRRGSANGFVWVNESGLTKLSEEYELRRQHATLYR